MATVSNCMDELKQATVNSLYNVINNDFGTNSVYGNMTCIYTNNEITQDNSIANVSCYVSGTSNDYCITMANLPYAISWLRNPQKIGLSTVDSTMQSDTSMLPNDLMALLCNGNFSQGTLTPYSTGSLSIVDGNNNDYCIKLCNSGYHRNSLTKSITKLSLNNTATVDTDTTNTNKAVVTATVASNGYNVVNAELTTCINNCSNKLGYNYCKYSINLNGYVNGWVNAPPNVYNNGNSVFTGVNVGDITWIKDSSGKVCTCTIEGVDDPFYRGCYLGYEVLFDEPEYKDNNPTTGIKITHNAARWIKGHSGGIPKFTKIESADIFYDSNSVDKLPMGSKDSMTLLRSHYDEVTESFGYSPIDIPLSAFTQRTYTDASDIATCSIGGTYTLTPSDPSVTISPGYTGGGKVKFRGYVIKSLSPSSYICNLSMGMAIPGNYIATLESSIGGYTYSICSRRSTSVNRFIQADTVITASIGQYYSITHDTVSLSNCNRCVRISIEGENGITISCKIDYATSGNKLLSIDVPYLYISSIYTCIWISFKSSAQLGAYGISDNISYTSYDSNTLYIKLNDSVPYIDLS